MKRYLLILATILYWTAVPYSHAESSLDHFKKLLGAESATLETIDTSGIGWQPIIGQRGTFVKNGTSMTIIVIRLDRGNLTFGGTIKDGKWLRGFMEAKNRPNRYWFDESSLRLDPRMNQFREYILELPSKFESARILSKQSI